MLTGANNDSKHDTCIMYYTPRTRLCPMTENELEGKKNVIFSREGTWLSDRLSGLLTSWLPEVKHVWLTACKPLHLLHEQYVSHEHMHMYVCILKGSTL